MNSNTDIDVTAIGGLEEEFCQNAGQEDEKV